jgi:hypothetical protein
LRLCLKSFRLEASEDDLNKIQQLRGSLGKNFSSMSQLLNDTKLEISYSYLSAHDYTTITSSAKQLIQHLGSLSSVNFSRESIGTHETELRELMTPIIGNMW